jgi:hypothetical protein
MCHKEASAAFRADIQSMCLEIINFFGRKRHSFVFGVSGLTAYIPGAVAFFILRRFDNIRRWRLGGIRRILRELSYFVRQPSHLF